MLTRTARRHRIDCGPRRRGALPPESDSLPMIEMFQSQWATNLAATPLLVGAITFHEGDGDALGPRCYRPSPVGELWFGPVLVRRDLAVENTIRGTPDRAASSNGSPAGRVARLPQGRLGEDRRLEPIVHHQIIIPKGLAHRASDTCRTRVTRTIAKSHDSSSSHIDKLYIYISTVMIVLSRPARIGPTNSI